MKHELDPAKSTPAYKKEGLCLHLGVRHFSQRRARLRRDLCQTLFGDQKFKLVLNNQAQIFSSTEILESGNHVGVLEKVAKMGCLNTFLPPITWSCELWRKKYSLSKCLSLLPPHSEPQHPSPFSVQKEGRGLIFCL